MYQGPHKPQVVVIGAGFTGLAAAFELARRGIAVTVLEKDNDIGGLAGSFDLNGQRLEKFYHHWFNHDKFVIDLARDIRFEDSLVCRPTQTGIYIANRIFKLAKPLDVLRFSPLSWKNRLRLGTLVLKARKVSNWKKLESITAEQWLTTLCGRRVYSTVWEPLLRGKFGPYASEISAVWFWNKLVMRGGSRSKAGQETLGYFRGGFSAFLEAIADAITSADGVICTGVSADALVVRDGRVATVETRQGPINADAVLATGSLPGIATLLEPHVSGQYLATLRRVRYLANLCLVIELSQSLSDIYWLNVGEPDFPFVGLIEHTNLEPTESYGGRHIVYLSKYLTQDAELYRMSKDQAFEFSLPYLKRVFPNFQRSWVQRCHLWKADCAQPIVERHYSRLVPAHETPLKGFYIATMAQIYPEDRGTNYAIRLGQMVAGKVAAQIDRPKG